MAREDVSPEDHQASHLSRENGGDLIVAALHYLRRSLEGDGETHWKSASSRQESCLQEWGQSLDLIVDSESFINSFERGGQEHDVLIDERAGRYFKLTRNGVFGFTPGIELALVSSGDDPRRFHLWEASPYLYLERLLLQNTYLTPGLNRLEGMVFQDGDVAILTSQPRFQLNSVTQAEIDEWFVSLGFRTIAPAAYYREEDNLGVFDAHDKNVVRAGDTLVPFDVIPCHPDGGFLSFIEGSVAKGQSLSAVRSTS